MSGVIFLKLIYLYMQKEFNKIESNEHQSIFDICLNNIQIFKNRFYSTFNRFISLNPCDRNENLNEKLQYCLVVQKHNKEKIDLYDVLSNISSYCPVEYEINESLNRIYLIFYSENCQHQIINDYKNHPVYKIEKFNWFRHSLIVKYSLGISILMTGICLFFLIKRQM